MNKDCGKTGGREIYEPDLGTLSEITHQAIDGADLSHWDAKQVDLLAVIFRSTISSSISSKILYQVQHLP